MSIDKVSFGCNYCTVTNAMQRGASGGRIHKYVSAAQETVMQDSFKLLDKVPSESPQHVPIAKKIYDILQGALKKANG